MAGPSILRERVPLPPPPSSIGVNEVITTKSGRWKVLASDTCLFRPHVPLFGRGVRTAYPLRVTVRWDGPYANVDGRVPLSALLLCGTWLTAATVWCVIAWPLPDFHMIAPLALLGSWAFVGGLTWWGIWFELRRARRILDEYGQAFARAAA